LAEQKQYKLTYQWYFLLFMPWGQRKIAKVGQSFFLREPLGEEQVVFWSELLGPGYAETYRKRQTSVSIVDSQTVRVFVQQVKLVGTEGQLTYKGRWFDSHLDIPTSMIAEKGRLVLSKGPFFLVIRATEQ
jgi:hypothetical protein